MTENIRHLTVDFRLEESPTSKASKALNVFASLLLQILPQKIISAVGADESSCHSGEVRRL